MHLEPCEGCGLPWAKDRPCPRCHSGDWLMDILGMSDAELKELSKKLDDILGP